MKASLFEKGEALHFVLQSLPFPRGLQEHLGARTPGSQIPRGTLKTFVYLGLGLGRPVSLGLAGAPSVSEKVY